MRIQIEIPEELFEQASGAAERENTSVDALVNEALRRTLAEHGQTSEFHLRDASFKGNGVCEPTMGWEQIRDLIYEGRGA